MSDLIPVPNNKLPRVHRNLAPQTLKRIEQAMKSPGVWFEWPTATDSSHLKKTIDALVGDGFKITSRTVKDGDKSFRVTYLRYDVVEADDPEDDGSGLLSDAVEGLVDDITEDGAPD